MPCEKANYAKLYKNTNQLNIDEFKKNFEIEKNNFRANYSQILEKSISRKFQESLERGNTNIDKIHLMINMESENLTPAYKLKLLQNELTELSKINKYISERLKEL